MGHREIRIGVAGTNGQVARICEGTPKAIWHNFWSQWRYNSRMPFGGTDKYGNGYLKDVNGAMLAYKVEMNAIHNWVN